MLSALKRTARTECPPYLVAVIMLAPMLLGAANSTTPTALITEPTFECISVRAKYDGDDNRNNTATVQWKPSSGSTWFNAYTPYRDVRGRLSSVSFGQDYDNSANSNQYRVSIVGLAPNTGYDVQITFSDGDGISGSASITNAVTTWSYAPLTNGTIRPVDPSLSPPWNEVSNAIANSTSGDTLVVSNGTYAVVNWLQSGTASGHIVVRAAPGHVPVISGGSLTNVMLSADYVVLDGFRFASFEKQGLVLSGARHHWQIQNCLFTNASTTAGAEQVAAIFIPDGCTNGAVLTNRFHTDRGSTTTTNVYAVFQGGCSNLVIADNVVTGTFWDAFGNGGNKVGNGPRLNCVFARNRILGYRDDSIEVEGDGINCCVWGNTVAPSETASSLLGASGVWVGPSYVFRNTFDGGALANLGMKIGSVPGRLELLHNVITTIAWPSGGHETVSGGSNTVARNNIILARGNVIYSGRGEDSWDYNLYTNTTDFVTLWNGVTTYATLAAFQSGTSQEASGRYDAPQLNSDFTPKFNSPSINAGVPLNNFNDAASAWPAVGVPDMGAFEWGSVSARVTGGVVWKGATIR